MNETKKNTPNQEVTERRALPEEVIQKGTSQRLPQQLIEAIGHGAALLHAEFNKRLNESATEEEQYEIIEKISD